MVASGEELSLQSAGALACIEELLLQAAGTSSWEPPARSCCWSYLGRWPVSLWQEAAVAAGWVVGLAATPSAFVKEPAGTLASSEEPLWQLVGASAFGEKLFLQPSGMSAWRTPAKGCC